MFREDIEINAIIEGTDLPIISSEDNIYINYDKFENKQIQVLYVTGLSGGGKSYLSKKIAKKLKCEYVELDSWFSPTNKWFDMYFTKHPKIAEGIEIQTWNVQVLVDAIEWILKNNKDKQFIFEGVHIPFMFHKEDIGDLKSNLFKDDSKYAVILIGTSLFKSVIRRFIRDGVFNKHTPYLIKKYRDWLRTQNLFRKDILNRHGISYKDFK